MGNKSTAPAKSDHSSAPQEKLGHLRTSLAIITKLKTHLIQEERRASALAENGDVKTAISVLSPLEEKTTKELEKADAEKNATRRFFTGGKIKRNIDAEKIAIKSLIEKINNLLAAQKKLLPPDTTSSAPLTDTHIASAVEGGTGLNNAGSITHKAEESPTRIAPLPTRPKAVSSAQPSEEHLTADALKPKRSSSELQLDVEGKPDVSIDAVDSSPTINPPSTPEDEAHSEDHAERLLPAAEDGVFTTAINVDRHALEEECTGLSEDDSPHRRSHRELEGSVSDKCRHSSDSSENEEDEEYEEYEDYDSPQLRHREGLDDEDEDLSEISNEYIEELSQLKQLMRSKRAFNDSTELGQFLRQVIKLAEEIKKTNINEAKIAISRTYLYLTGKMSHEVYHGIASNMQGKPSPKLSALGAAMMALSAAVFALGIILAPSFLTIAASAAIAATGYGLFAKGQQATGLSLSMLELEKANKIASIDFEDREEEENESLLIPSGKAA